MGADCHRTFKLHLALSSSERDLLKLCVMFGVLVVCCVHEDSHRLPNHTEREPEDDIAHRTPGVFAMQKLGDCDQRDLHHHPNK